MAFLQPTSTLIRRIDFRGKVYTFLVESRLKSLPSSATLRLEVTAGYQLLTSSANTAQSMQTLAYVSQPDGSYLAQATVVLKATGPALVSGIVILRDALGGVLRLTIDIASLLIVDGTTLTFDAKPHTQTATILKISQQGADTPIVLSTDDPGRFALATSKKELDFVPNLSFTPPFGGTYIHVRYAPKRAGQHAAHLFVKTPYDTQIVALEGKAPGLFSGLLPLWNALRVTPANLPATTWFQKISILTGLVMVGLTWAGYTYRCQLAPDWCRVESTVETQADVDIPLADIPVSTVSAERLERAPTPKINGETEYPDHFASPWASLMETTDEPAKPVIIAPTKLYRQQRTKQRPIQTQKTTGSVSQESDLERELNRAY